MNRISKYIKTLVRIFSFCVVAISLLLIPSNFSLVNEAQAADCEVGSWEYDWSSCTVAVDCDSVNRLRVIYNAQFAATNFSAPNIFVEGKDTPDECTFDFNLTKVSGGDDCAYKIYKDNGGARMNLNTKRRNGATNCEIRANITAPRTMKINNIIANKAWASVEGMTNEVIAKSTTGDLRADVTSNKVVLLSETGNLWASGLKKTATLRTCSDIRAFYCVIPTTNNSLVTNTKISGKQLTCVVEDSDKDKDKDKDSDKDKDKDSDKDKDKDSDKDKDKDSDKDKDKDKDKDDDEDEEDSHGNIDVQFLPTTGFKEVLDVDLNKYRNDMGNCPTCRFKYKPSSLGHVYVIEKNVPAGTTNDCPY